MYIPLVRRISPAPFGINVGNALIYFKVFPLVRMIR